MPPTRIALSVSHSIFRSRMGKRARAGKQNENECENESEIGSGELNIVIIGNPSSPPLRKKYEKKFRKTRASRFKRL